ncbi:hypothetical protein GUITHDRAFT_114990 [Guillardia theta CCMP2712]|uniref:HTH myb-type domain-containing protein n=1 Tax=Guillardia theta (strain CCMP2712) TaxID=905079 RepID=L1IRM4_GUITC|nr:hypothetical protein GUITHDRAFT_114990 [Guillardia theta CCMP2712]EKX38883.1 hypothetical protein GUITHDRAFT_114990 [Guillardia theta CCMP2712]|eukprot:XP_005825863.1 hypothetical protein GUITHDRAFT_114990 [Guillardia theta CCMP2712]
MFLRTPSLPANPIPIHQENPAPESKLLPLDCSFDHDFQNLARCACEACSCPPIVPQYLPDLSSASMPAGSAAAMMPSLHSDHTSGSGKRPAPPRAPPAAKRPWTPEEEERFLAAMDRFYKPKEDEGGVGLGQGVAEVIAFIVGTRTAAQVRSHAQKYFLRKRRALVNT